jgi:hypothetical protein
MTKNFDSATWGRLATVNTNQRDDAGYVIPGSGDSIPCDCCGRGITVHVSIANADTKETATIGEQCAKKAGLRHLKCLTQHGERYMNWREVWA